eukprot:scaffold28957_cov112-Isochrysis_galbana.AAC.6
MQIDGFSVGFLDDEYRLTTGSTWSEHAYLAPCTGTRYPPRGAPARASPCTRHRVSAAPNQSGSPTQR